MALTFQNLSFLTPQALETMVVTEEKSGNCPVCVDPFQMGDQVSLESQPALQDEQLSCVRSSYSRAARHLTFTAATLLASRAGSPGGGNASFCIVTPSSFSQYAQ